MENDKKTKVFLTIAISIIVISLAVVIGGFVYILNSGNGADNEKADSNDNSKKELIDDNGEESEKDEFASLPVKTVFAVYGVDKNEALADVILVASFNKNTKKVSTISIPRDTFVKIPKDRLEELREMGLWAPSEGMKINAVHSYAGKYGNEYLTKQIEDLLGITIDYYFEVNLDGFTAIVDEVGGVEIDVPRRMYYRDPTQNLTINLQPGLQLLDGEQAQGFVRFRQLVRGDIDRIENQKIFLKAFCEQVLNKETIKENAVSFAGIALRYVKTDMSLKEIIKYTPALMQISPNNITMETLPGDGMTPYHHDEDKTREIVNRLFYDVYETTEEITSEDNSLEIITFD